MKYNDIGKLKIWGKVFLANTTEKTKGWSGCNNIKTYFRAKKITTDKKTRILKFYC